MWISCGETRADLKEGFNITEKDSYNDFIMPKRTYQPKKKKRARKHGFLKRSKSPGGAAVLKKRRTKKRKRLTV